MGDWRLGEGEGEGDEVKEKEGRGGGKEAQRLPGLRTPYCTITAYLLGGRDGGRKG